MIRHLILLHRGTYALNLPAVTIANDIIIGVWRTPPAESLLVLFTHSDIEGKIGPERADGIRVGPCVWMSGSAASPYQ
jgi:hypothetical protein